MAVDCEAVRPRYAEAPFADVRSWPKTENVLGFQGLRNGLVSGLAPLQATARERRSIFAALMEAVKTHSLGQISHALYEVGGGIGGICSSRARAQAMTHELTS